MLTKLAHMPTPKSDVSQKLTLHQKNAAKPAASEFSQSFGDFVTSCLVTDLKQVSLTKYVSETLIRSMTW